MAWAPCNGEVVAEWDWPIGGWNAGLQIEDLEVGDTVYLDTGWPLPVLNLSPLLSSADPSERPKLFIPAYECCLSLVASIAETRQQSSRSSLCLMDGSMPSVSGP